MTTPWPQSPVPNTSHTALVTRAEMRENDVKIIRKLYDTRRYVRNVFFDEWRCKRPIRREFCHDQKKHIYPLRDPPNCHTFLGLLAKIKCSICSYQFNIWYTGIPVTILNEFFRGASQKAVLARQGARMASGLHCITRRSPLQHKFAQSTEVVIERLQTQLNSCAVKIPPTSHETGRNLIMTLIKSYKYP